MKVTHVITGLSVGGAEMMLLKLLSSIPFAECESQVICLTSPGKIAERLQELGVSVKALNMARGRLNPLAFVRLARELQRGSPDLVQTWMYHADLYGGMASKISRLPVIWGIRNGALDRSNKRTTVLTAKLCAKLSGVLPAEITCVSHAAREFHQHFGYSSKKLKVIPNGFDLSRFKPNVAARSRIRSELKISSGAQVVGLVARFDPQKDHETFISGAALVQRQLPNTVFLLCGDEVDCRNQLLLRHIENSGGKAAFRMLGRRDDIADVTAAFDVAVNCSVAEGFSNAIGEAMACGIPCVVTDVGDSAQVVGQTGIVVPPRNPVALAAGILRLLTAPNYAALSSAARTRIHDEFEIEKITAKYLDLYRAVLACN